MKSMRTVWLLTFFKISYFVFCKKKKKVRKQVIHVWNNMKASHFSTVSLRKFVNRELVTGSCLRSRW